MLIILKLLGVKHKILVCGGVQLKIQRGESTYNSLLALHGIISQSLDTWLFIFLRDYIFISLIFKSTDSSRKEFKIKHNLQKMRLCGPTRICKRVHLHISNIEKEHNPFDRKQLLG